MLTDLVLIWLFLKTNMLYVFPWWTWWNMIQTWVRKDFFKIYERAASKTLNVIYVHKVGGLNIVKWFSRGKKAQMQSTKTEISWFLVLSQVKYESKFMSSRLEHVNHPPKCISLPAAELTWLNPLPTWPSNLRSQHSWSLPFFQVVSKIIPVCHVYGN